jgi:hypothetical protein
MLGAHKIAVPTLIPRAVHHSFLDGEALRPFGMPQSINYEYYR